jgi:anti-anti-sigma factor
LTITTQKQDHLVIVSLAGELDLAAGPRLDDVLRTIMAGAECDIMVDLTNLRFLDCSGLSVLVRCRRQAVETGRTLRAVGAGGTVAEVLQVTGVADLLRVSTLADRTAVQP